MISLSYPPPSGSSGRVYSVAPRWQESPESPHFGISATVKSSGNDEKSETGVIDESDVPQIFPPHHSP